MGKTKRTLLILAAVVFVIAGLSRISFNVEILKLLPGHLRQVEGLGMFLKHFSLPTELLILLEGADAEKLDAEVASLEEGLRARGDLARRVVAAPPWEKDPAQLAEFLAWMLLNQPPEAMATFRASMDPEKIGETLGKTLERLNESMSPREMALLGYDPLGFTQVMAGEGLFSAEMQSEFSSADGTFRVIYVEAAPTLGNYKANIAWINEVKAFTQKWNDGRGLKIGFTGEPAFVADISGTMEWDMASSGFVTLFVISGIFYVCYRRHKPLPALLTMLGIVFVISLAAAGLFLDDLTVIGVGFASIMIGLSVDYGYLIYEKSLHHQGTLKELQRDCLQNIFWTAGTTAAAFFSLNLSSLPGLAQLGNLVGIGVIIGAAVMLILFAPIAMRWKVTGFSAVSAEPHLLQRVLRRPGFIKAGTWLTFGLVLVLLGTLFIKGPPGFDFGSRTLRPRHSGAYDAMDKLYARLADDRELVSVIASGTSETQVYERLRVTDEKLLAAKERGDLEDYRSTLALWPAEEHQRQNLKELQSLVAAAPRLKQAVLDAGFNEEAFLLASGVLKQWGEWAEVKTPFWPQNDASRWILRRTASHKEGGFAAMGVIRPAPGKAESIEAEVATEGVRLASWKLLGAELQRVIPAEFVKLILGLLVVIFVILFFGFGSLRDVLLLAVTMGLVFCSLAGAMSLLGMQWNFFNLSALLLLLGTGIDYAVLLLLAIRRNGGDFREAQSSLGLVIILCAASAAAGFGTIGWANNLGLASLGITCALGLVIDALISIFLLPHLWRFSRMLPGGKK